MEVYFVDVGLGSCHVILLGGRRALVIDCGVRSDHIALQFLQRNGVEQVDRLITSHSDGDHTGGAISILDHYAENIEKICVVQDHKFLKSRYWRRLFALKKEGRIHERQISPPLLPEDDLPKLVWEDRLSGAKLRCFSPTFVENLEAQQSCNSNGSSMVFVLDYQGRRVVLAADSVVPQWRRIYERRGNRTLECDILAVPHHGGLTEGINADLDWLYDQAIRCDVAIFSVGTVRRPKHPRAEVVAKLRSIGATVLCTEITSLCNESPMGLKPGVLQPQVHMGRAMNLPKKPYVPCAGTVLATISNGSIEVDRLQVHQNAVDHLATTSKTCPLCRLSLTIPDEALKERSV
jgi:competence protein ComEC